ncbi:MAG: ATPase, T2SS/T4P/T4SS family [Bdellovibrionales bacterium]
MAIHDSCHLICVVGGKGGVGKSVFAANLAAAFLQEIRQPTLLLDVDAKSAGDQNVILGVRPLKTMSEVANFAGAITAQSLPTLVTPHSSGLGFIGAVQGPEQSLNVQADLLRKQLFALSQHYRFIIADLGCDLEALQLGLIEDASGVVVVATPEILVVNQTKKILNDLFSASFPADLFQVVLNKASRGGIDPRAISQALRRPILAQIPQDDTTAYSALQRSSPFVLSSPTSPMSLAYHDVVRQLTGGILQKLKSTAKPKASMASAAPARPGAPTLAGAVGADARSLRVRGAKKAMDPITLLKIQVHTALIKEMDLKKDLVGSEGDPEKAKELRSKTQRIVSTITDRIGGQLSREERAKVIKEVLDEALGLGPLEELLADPTVTEIMVNGADMIYIEKSGKLQLSNVTFTSNSHLRTVIERIVNPLGRRIDERTPYVDARLADGSRVNAVIEPLSIDGPAVTIRKFPTERIGPDDYVTRFNTMTRSMIELLRICVEQGLNIIISGGTGSGKTTLLNVMSTFIPSNERIVTVEDAAELQMKQDHVVRLETRPANMEGTGEITIRDLIRNSLRMRPDRIIVGECRDGAALDMLSAMNTGHDGSMTTVHANSPREAVSRLETLCLMAGLDLPVRAIREQIAGAVDLIVQISRLSDGSRRVLSITEVVGMQGETITLQEIFRYKEEGFDKNRKIIGQFQPMGMIPTFIEDFEARGVVVPRNLFIPGGQDEKAATSGAAGKTPSATSMSKPRLPSSPPAAPAAGSSATSPVKKASGGGEG